MNCSDTLTSARPMDPPTRLSVRHYVLFSPYQGNNDKTISHVKMPSTIPQRIIDQMGVNSNSFRKFMDPQTYKNQWSATQNGTYWAGAKLLARVEYEKELAKKSSSGKRKSAGTGSAAKRAKTDDIPRKKSSTELKLESMQLVNRIEDVQGVREGLVYDTCPQLVTKIKAFLQRDGITKKYFLMALGNVNSNSLNTFLSGKNQDQCGNVAYRTSYVFFEKFRILEGKSRSAARLKNERENPYGFSLEKARPARWIHPSFHSAFSGGYPGW
mmetsp:Transcript_13625/g.29644  ORF Transcript_13625/g.29644 Transcript_13625/m.29644 type:complete len:270 (+) Transcript_13625:368-1177(+)